MINYNTQRLVFTKSNRSLIEDMIAYFTVKTMDTVNVDGNTIEEDTVYNIITDLSNNLKFILELNKCLIEIDTQWTGNVDIDSQVIMHATSIYTNGELHSISMEDYMYSITSKEQIQHITENTLFIAYSNTSASIYFIKEGESAGKLVNDDDLFTEYEMMATAIKNKVGDAGLLVDLNRPVYEEDEEDSNLSRLKNLPVYSVKDMVNALDYKEFAIKYREECSVKSEGYTIDDSSDDCVSVTVFGYSPELRKETEELYRERFAKEY